MTNGPLCLEHTSPAVPAAHTPKEPASAGQPPAAPSSPEVCTTVYGPDSAPNGFEALQAEWNALLRRSRFNTIFLTYEWQTTWWEYLGEGELWILAMR